MQIFLYIIAATVGILLRVIYIAMFIEAILSWFLTEDHPVMALLLLVTAPIVLPVRALLSRIPALQRIPIDLSFLVAFLLLVLVMNALPPVSLPTM